MIKRYHTVVCSLSILLLAYAPLLGQIPELSFHHITVDDGLSQNTVLCIYQDSKGFLWIGTQDGLNRYDGYTFTVYKHDVFDSNSISLNYVWAILEDHAGALWIGTDGGGLNQLDRNTGRFIHYMHDPESSASLSSNFVLSIYEDRSGTLWIGTTGGLNKLDRTTHQFSHYVNESTSPHSLSHNNARAIYEDHTGTLWIGTDGGGLNRFDRSTGRFTRFLADPENPHSLSHNRVRSIHEDRAGTLWIGTWGGGLNRFDREKELFTRFVNDPKNPASLSHNAAMAVLESRTLADQATASLWVATLGGLDRFDPAKKQFTRFVNNPSDPHSLGTNSVISLYEDRSGALWIGTLGGGLNRCDLIRKKFAHVVSDPGSGNSLGNNSVWSLFKDHTGTLWIGTDGGLDRLDPATREYTHFANDPAGSHSISHNSVRPICEDRNGTLWIGTWGGGLNQLVLSPGSAGKGFDPKSVKFIRYAHNPENPRSIADDRIYAIYEDRSGTLWIGGWGGLHKLVPDAPLPGRGAGRRESGGPPPAFIRYVNDPKDPYSLSHTIVTSILEDQTGTLWIGTWGGGLNRFDWHSERFTRFVNDSRNPSSLGSNNIHSIFEDHKGTLWIAGGGGLNRFDRATGNFVHYTEKDGLPSSETYGILEDENGQLWVSTDKGLSRFDPSATIFKNFDASDGLQSNEFNEGAFFKSKTGEMFFGGINGFNRFNPSQIRDNSYLPPIAITSFKKFNKEAALDTVISEIKTLVLTYEEKVFSFEFAALNYILPHKNQYAYMMSGFDTGWVRCGAKREAGYTNLDAGEYTFLVKGSNNDGIWNPAGASVKLFIRPPFWKTWWFGSLSVFSLGLIVYMLYRYRVNQLLAMERLRIRLASDLHDELATNLSSIGMFGEILQQPHGADPVTRARLLDRITSLSRESATSIRDIIWAIDPKVETLHGLLLRIRETAVISCKAKNIVLNFDLPLKDQLPHGNLLPETRRDLFLVMKEAIANAIKHSQCTELTVQTHFEDRFLKLQIVDNGGGFDFLKSSRGRGLGTMKMRSGKLGGSFELVSGPGQGTTVVVTARI